MAYDTVVPYGEVHQDKPGTNANGSQARLQVGRRGELLVAPLGKPAYRMAEEGSYFVATNPTVGTAVAGIAATGAFSDLETYFFIRNNASASDGTRMYIDYIRLISSAGGANGTDVRWAIKLDTGSTRYTSGGSAITPVNPNMQSSATTVGAMYAGALVTAAASTQARLISSGQLRPVIGVAGDHFTFDFGAERSVPAGVPIEGTLVAHICERVPPVILGSTDMMLMSIHHSAQTAATSYEFEVGWWER